MAIRGNQSSAPLRSTKIGWLVMRSASARTSGVCSVAEKRSVCSRPPVRPTGGSFAIRGNQRQSEAIRGNQNSSPVRPTGGSFAIRGNQRQSEAIRGNQRQSELLTCPTDRRQLRNQRQSEAIRGNQRQSEAIRTPHLSADRRQLRMQFEDRVEMSRVEQPVSFVEHEELRGRERGGGVSRERRKRSQSEALRH